MFLAVAAAVFAVPGRTTADPYVTPASAHRWNAPSGIRFNDAGGIRFTDAGGLLFTDASGIRFTDAGGIRFTDAGGIRFTDAGGQAAISLDLLDLLPVMADTSSINVVVSYEFAPTTFDFDALRAIGITGGTVFRRLPMVVVTATRSQIALIAELPNVRSVWADRALAWVVNETRPWIGADQADQDPLLRTPTGLPFAGRGVTIAFVDTGIDATHPDLPFGTKVIQNVRVEPAGGLPGVFTQPVVSEGIANTDLVLGHGTFAAGIAAGTGQASGGVYRGVAPEADLVGVSVGDVYLVNVLEGFDWILDHAGQYGIRVVNCSFATTGPFDPEDPVNLATKAVYDAGITVVFAAGNYGPGPDTMSPFAVAPWVIGVASGDKSGHLSAWSSRGIFNEGLYRPTLTAPGERIVSTSSVSLQGVFGASGAPPSTKDSVPTSWQPWYSEASGTSFAAPHVAAVVALMIEADPTLDPDAIKRILQTTATPMQAHDRSEAGAGYLDAWAALSAVLDGTRPFGRYQVEMLEERRFEYVFSPFVEFEGTVPPGGNAVVPMQAGAATFSIQAGLAWGPTPAGVDLDVTVVDAAGNEVARSDSLGGLGVFGRHEGVSVAHPGGPLNLVVSARVPQIEAVVFNGQYESIDALPPPLTDLWQIGPADRTVATRALVSLAMEGRVNPHRPWRGQAIRVMKKGSDMKSEECFCADKHLVRGEAARLVALAAHLPQSVPATPTYEDVPADHPVYAYVESTSGAQARRGSVIAAATPTRFRPEDAISRIELAVAAVEALGLGDEAAAHTGSLGLEDEGQIPTAWIGHAAIAIDLGILSTTPTPTGDALYPVHAITRMDAARAAVAILEAARGPS